MSHRVVAIGLGLLFGFMISWGHFTDPDEIREMLLVQDPYLWKMFATAVAVAFAGSRLIRGRRAWLVRERVSWTTTPPGRHHLVGAVTFGIGWAVAASCPAPIAAQLAQGVWWSAFTFAGVAIGVQLYQRGRAGAPHVDAGPDTPSEVTAGALPAGPSRRGGRDASRIRATAASGS